MWLWATHSGWLSVHKACAARTAAIRLYSRTIFQRTPTGNEPRARRRWVLRIERRRQTLPCTHGARLQGVEEVQ